MNDGAIVTILLALLGGAIRVSTPFLFVSLGECLTEKAGRINLGLEGILGRQDPGSAIAAADGEGDKNPDRFAVHAVTPSEFFARRSRASSPRP